jgi:hypothetical protein
MEAPETQPQPDTDAPPTDPDEGGEGNQGEGPAEGDDVDQDEVEAVERGDTGGSGDRATEVERAAAREDQAKEG